MRTKAVFDNSSFAGVMRLFAPDLEMHRHFFKNYPAHRVIDEHSLADFLTAICLYDSILLESSSTWNDIESRREGMDGSPSSGISLSWADGLKALLPAEIAELVETGLLAGSTISEADIEERAYDIMTSELASRIELPPNTKLPNVYFARDYIYRPRFEELNRQNNRRLDQNHLAQAMFLHRGLFLQSCAHGQGCVYIPYHLRGSMLAQLPPMCWAAAPDDGLIRARLPLAIGSRPGEERYMKELNEFYYNLLKGVTWRTYGGDVPFVGAAILARARGNPQEAFKIATEYRQEGSLRTMFRRLREAVEAQDRPLFESLLREFRNQLSTAARSFGLMTDDGHHRAFYDLATCWLPGEAAKVIEAAVQILPEFARHWAYTTSSAFISKTSLQLLFTSHVDAIRS